MQVIVEGKGSAQMKVPPPSPPGLRLGMVLFLWVLVTVCAGYLVRLFPCPQGPALVEGVQILEDKGKLHEARLLARYGLERGLADREQLTKRLAELESTSQSWWRKAGLSAKGFFTGSGDSAEEMAGAVAADLVLLGHLRDLGKEAVGRATGGESDPLVTSLAGIGTLMTVSPPMALGISLLKNTAKFVPEDLKQQMVAMVQQARETGDWTGLKELLSDLGTLAKQEGAAAAILVVRAVTDLEDMRLLTRLALIRGADVQSVLVIYGDPGRDLMLQCARREKGPWAFRVLYLPEWAQRWPWWAGLLQTLIPALLVALLFRSIERFLWKLRQPAATRQA